MRSSIIILPFKRQDGAKRSFYLMVVSWHYIIIFFLCVSYFLGINLLLGELTFGPAVRQSNSHNVQETDGFLLSLHLYELPERSLPCGEYNGKRNWKTGTWINNCPRNNLSIFYLLFAPVLISVFLGLSHQWISDLQRRGQQLFFFHIQSFISSEKM